MELKKMTAKFVAVLVAGLVLNASSVFANEGDVPQIAGRQRFGINYGKRQIKGSLHTG
jgi:hypothetical protein